MLSEWSSNKQSSQASVVPSVKWDEGDILKFHLLNVYLVTPVSLHTIYRDDFLNLHMAI